MRKSALIVIMLVACATLALAAALFYPIYWINGTASGAGEGSIVEGRSVVFYRTAADYAAGQYGSSAVSGGRYMLNAFSRGLDGMTVGGTYYVAIPNDNPANPAAGYGAGPVPVTISGVGYETAPNLTLATGAGVISGGPTTEPVPVIIEPPPTIQIWFGSRLYQPSLVTEEKPFVISNRTMVKAQINIENPYTLARDVASYSIVIDPESASAEALDLREENIARRVFTAGTAPEEGKLSAMSLEYNITNALADGKHLFAVSAMSSGTVGTASTRTEYASVEVLGGPVRIIGAPLTYPSPVSIGKDKVVTIQYQLSRDADIQITFSSVAGRLVKNFVRAKGTDGGSAGVNKITWDGRTDRGTLAGNGIYLGTIISGEDKRKIGTVKLTVLD